MAITINNGIANIDNTPGAASGVFSNRPSATNVAEGTLYFSTDTAAIYQAVAGSWINYAGGGGGGTSTGINGLNGTTNIGLGGTLLNATAINADSFSFEFNTLKTFNVIDDTATPTNFEIGNGIIQTFSGINQVGLKLDFNVNEVVLGDAFNNYTGTVFNINQSAGIFSYSNALNIEVGIDTFRFQMVNTTAFLGMIYVAGDNNGVQFNLTDPGGEIKTSAFGQNIGFNLNFNNNIYKFGAVDAAGASFVIDNGNSILYTINGLLQTTGLNFDFIAQSFLFGDLINNNFIDFNNSGIGYVILNAQNNFSIKNSNVENGLKIDFTNFSYSIGDFNFANNGISIFINDDANYISANYQQTEGGFKLDFINNQYKFGNFTNGANLFIDGSSTFLRADDDIYVFSYGVGGFYAGGGLAKIGDVNFFQNNTQFGVDDANRTLIGSQNLTTVNAGGNSGLHLKINIDGTNYVIQLLNP